MGKDTDMRYRPGEHATDRRPRPLAWRLAPLLQATWGLPQTVLGMLFFLALRRKRRTWWFRSAVVTEWQLASGFSLGQFIFVPRRCPYGLMLHEYGHTLQSLLLGPLYLPCIVLPSLAWAGIPACERYRRRHQYSYYRFFCERWANRLSNRVTGERPIGW